MAKDFMRYDLMAQDALRGVVRMALTKVKEDGLHGAHHFFITFITSHDGVELSDALMTRYPVEMTIVLQHQFWDLDVQDDHFSVCLSFNKMPERLVIPYKAIRGFIDPSVQFGLEFQVEGAPVPEQSGDKTGKTLADVTAFDRVSNAGQDTETAPPAPPQDDDAAEEKTGEVVSLDAFRKK